MALPDLTGQNIQDTYKRVLQKGDDGQLYDGTGSAVPIKFDGDNVIISGSLTAMTYIVSESIVASTSGSSILGNSTDDTHQFTGSVDVLGDVDATGKVQAEHLTSTDDATITNDLVLGGAIIHAADIDTKIEFTTDQIDLQTGNAIKLRLTNTLNTLNQDTKVDGDLEVTGHITASGVVKAASLYSTGEITGSGWLVAGSASFDGHVTASGNIYAGGDINPQGDLILEYGKGIKGQFDDVGLEHTFFVQNSFGGIVLGSAVGDNAIAGDINTTVTGSIVTLSGDVVNSKANSGDVFFQASDEVKFKSNLHGSIGSFTLGLSGEATMSHGIVADGSASFGGDITGSGIIKGGSLYSTGEITGSGWLVAGSASFDGHVTSSGNIKANTKIISGDSSGEGFHLGEGVIALDANSTEIRLGVDATWTAIDIGKGNAPTKNIRLYGPVTGSSVIEAASFYSTGEITGSGWLVAGSASFDGHVTASGDVSVGTNLYVANEIIDPNNTSKKIDFNPSTGNSNMQIKYDGTKYHQLSSGTTIFNYNAQDWDTIIKGGNDSALLYVDAGQDKVGIGQDPLDLDTSAKFNVTGDMKISSHITSSGNISSSAIIYAPQIMALPIGVADAAVDANFIIGPALFTDGDLGATNINGSELISAPQININPVGVGDAAVDIDLFVGAGFFDGDVDVSGNLTLGSLSGPVTVGDPLGSLTLSGSLTFKANEATPSVSASTIYNNNGHLYYGSGLLGGYHLSASADNVGTIKILSTGWINNDDSGTYQRLIFEDDSNVYGTKPANINHEIYKAVDIPAGWTATKYMIYSNVANTIDFIVVNLIDGTGTTDGVSATANTEFTLDSPYTSTPSTYALLKYDPNATTNIIYGGYIIIERR